MYPEVSVVQLQNVAFPDKVRKPGRPRAIPTEFESVVSDLYRKGYGYRAVASIIIREYSVNPHFSSVRRAVKRLGILG
jgi:hypothetical protein